MAERSPVSLLGDGRRNAVIAWILVVVAALGWIGDVLVSGPIWSVFALVVVGLALLPPIVARSWTVMLPWEVLALATLPLIGFAIEVQRFTGPVIAYIAVATVALVIVVELEAFTDIHMTPAFAVGLVVISTLAAAALWALLQWYVAIGLDRAYTTTNDELMIEFLYATIAGLAAGIIFHAYFRRTARRAATRIETAPEGTDA